MHCVSQDVVGVSTVWGVVLCIYILVFREESLGCDVGCGRVSMLHIL